MRRFVIGSLVLASMAIATVRCYGPTVVTVDLSTDLECTKDLPETWIFKSSGEATPGAKTKTCTSGTAGDAEIGTIAFVPSGDRDGRVEVKAVLARNGKSPGTCEADPSDCIIATRTFSFEPHESRRVPIRLTKECLGTKCPVGQTCVGPGQCSSSDIGCTGPSCGTITMVPPAEGGVPPPPGGDAGGDSGVDAGHPQCTAPDGGHILFSATHAPFKHPFVASSFGWLYWADGAAVWGIPKTGDGGEKTLFANLPGPIVAIGSDGDEGAAVVYDNSGLFVRTKTLPGTPIPSATTASGVFVSGSDVWVATDKGVYDVSHGDFLQSGTAANDVAADATNIYIADSDGIRFTTRAARGTPALLANATAAGVKNAEFLLTWTSSSDAFVGATGARTGGGRLIAVSPIGNPSAADEDAVIRPGAVDAFYIVHARNTVLARKVNAFAADGPAPAMQVLKPSASVTALFTEYDKDNGCLYLWETNGGTQQLEVMQKRDE